MALKRKRNVKTRNPTQSIQSKKEDVPLWKLASIEKDLRSESTAPVNANQPMPEDRSLSALPSIELNKENLPSPAKKQRQEGQPSK